MELASGRCTSLRCWPITCRYQWPTTSQPSSSQWQVSLPPGSSVRSQPSENELPAVANWVCRGLHCCHVLHGHGGDNWRLRLHDSKLVALDRDRGQCIPDRSVAGFPSAHRQRRPAGACGRSAAMIMGNAITGMHYTAMAAVSFGQPTNRWNSRRWTTLLGELELLILMLALIASFSISASVPRPQGRGNSPKKSASAPGAKCIQYYCSCCSRRHRFRHKFVRQTDFCYEPEDWLGKRLLNLSILMIAPRQRAS